MAAAHQDTPPGGEPSKWTPIEAALPPRARRAADDLWSALASTLKREGCSRVMFTALERDAGCTTVVAQSVLGLVRNARRSASIVETDLAGPALASYLGVPPAPGLAQLLDGAASFEDVARAVPGCPGLTVVSAGSGRAPITGEFASKEATGALERLRSEHETLVVDAPPLIEHAESRVLLDAVDGVIVVVRARSSRAEGLAATERLLAQQGVPLFGVIVNRYRSDMPFGLD